MATIVFPLSVSLCSNDRRSKTLEETFEGAARGGGTNVRGVDVKSSPTRLDDLDATDEKLNLETQAHTGKFHNFLHGVARCGQTGTENDKHELYLVHIPSSSPTNEIARRR